MKVKENFEHRIYEARKKKKMTQQELATKIYVSDKAISNWETGKNLPDAEMIKKLEKILDIDLIEETESKKVFTKWTILKSIFLLAIVCVLVVSTIAIYSRNKTEIYEIELNSKSFYLKNSHLLITKDSIILSTGKIENIELPYQPEYKATLYYKEKDQEIEIISKEKYDSFYLVDSKKSQEEWIKHIDAIYLKIEYKGYDGEKVIKNIQVNCIQMQPQKEEIEDSQLVDTITLLHNNGYKEIELGRYEKKVKEDIYTFDVRTETFYIEGKKEDIMYYAIKRNKEKGSYVIIKNNEVIEYRTTSRNNGNKYKSLIEEKIIESQKIGIN